MRRAHLLIGAAFALTSVWAVAQDAPESLLPPGFDAPTATPAPRPAASKGAQVTQPTDSGSGPRTVSIPVIQAIPGVSSHRAAPIALPANLPSLAQLEAMSPDELDELFGLKPKYDIPPSARRSMEKVGILDEAEGGLRPYSLVGQNGSLVRAVLAGNNGILVSRWGHILLRRALASRLDAPAQMEPADFAALRAALLVRMGEGEAARSLVQDVDGANYSPMLTQAALDSYVATADLTGACPLVTLQGEGRKDNEWQILRAICEAFSGDGSRGLAQLDRATSRGVMPRIDMLLAQKYAGAAGKARRAVTIEWNDVQEMTPWRYALTIATGLEPPAALMKDVSVRYDYVAATAPMLALSSRAAAADRAAGAGVLSSAAMVDLYSQIYADGELSGEWSDRATQLRDSYVAEAPDGRLAAMKSLWSGTSSPAQYYSRQVLTAYAAARLPVLESYKRDAGDVIASMLAAGLDRNALRWRNLAEPGSQAWALLALATPDTSPVDESAVSSFYDDDSSDNARKSAFLLAGLAGLGRISEGKARSLAGDWEIDLDRQSRWTRLIDEAAKVNNQTLVVLLAGVGMQGDGWDKMTPRYLYHIVSALSRVGLDAEARMIAAEAVARG